MSKRVKYIWVHKAVDYLKEVYEIDVTQAAITGWIRNGMYSANSGKKRKLKGVKRFNRWYTTKEWLDKFIEEASEMYNDDEANT